MQTLFPEIEKTRAALAALPCPWWVAGGWALDMFLGRQTRPHKDIEVAIARDDQAQLLVLPGLGGVEYVEEGEKKPWRGQRLALPVHELYARFHNGRVVEVLLNEFEGGDWLYRRNRAVRLPRAAFGAGGFLPPEIVLLYKSKNPRSEDLKDFNGALEHLSAEQRKWLSESIALDYPEHPWLKKLAGGSPSLTGASRGKF